MNIFVKLMRADVFNDIYILLSSCIFKKCIQSRPGSSQITAEYQQSHHLGHRVLLP